MTNDIICIHQGEDGTVCGRIDHDRNALWCIHDYAPEQRKQPRGAHRFVPGRKCPTCDGRGFVMEGHKEDGDWYSDLCSTCAASPVHGYVRAE